MAHHDPSMVPLSSLQDKLVLGGLLALDAELEFLRWFYQNADFGPGEADYMSSMMELYSDETGKPVPPGYGGDE